MTPAHLVSPLQLPEREISIPVSISEEAQQLLAQGSPAAPVDIWPPLDDADAWHALRVTFHEQAMATLAQQRGMPGGEPTDVASVASGAVEVEVDGVRVYEVVPDGVQPSDPRVYMDIHGGAFAFGGGEVCRFMAVGLAPSIGARVWSVDYRMPPDHPHPAPLDDCVAVYKALLKERRPEEIIVGGISSGGNLAAALALRVRDDGLPMPAAAVLCTALVDLTYSGDSWQTNLGLDPVLTGVVEPVVLLYAASHDLREPYLSPLFGDLTKGFPPTILTTGTRDRLLSDSVRMHRALRAAGVLAELHVWEAAGHGQWGEAAPEGAEQAAEVRSFIDRQWGSPRC